MNEPKITINRKKENEEVLEYQNTKSEALLAQIIERRLETLSYFATKKYTNMIEQHIGSLDDFKSELTKPLIYAINTFKTGGKDFNTVLYTCILNYIANLNKAYYARKRANQGVMSLDTPVNNMHNKEEAAYIDLIASNYRTYEYNQDNLDIIALKMSNMKPLKAKHTKEEIKTHLIQIIEGDNTYKINRTLNQRLYKVATYLPKNEQDELKELIYKQIGIDNPQLTDSLTLA